MSSETFVQLPTIDFCNSDLKPGTSEWELLKSQVWKAISEYGSFRALYGKIPLHLQKSFLGEVKEFFDLPLQTKKRYVSEVPFDSYSMSILPASLRESFGVGDPTTLKNCEDFANVLWPQGNPSFSKNIHAFSKQVSEFEIIIRRMILESLNLENYQDHHMNATTLFLRIMKYHGMPEGTKTTDALSPHTDQNLITILHQNQVDGIEVQSKDGEWTSVELSPDHSFVILIGKSFNAWTNGRLRAPYHRVRMTGNEARYSAGFFTGFKAGHFLKAPEELIDEEHPLLYKPYDYFEFLKFLKTWVPNAKPYQCGLKAYCGV
ncbi:unnamed protein product [Dovyalis caffra]|uniref:Fe2OG dioxygenase domain-containing protein n=1 Tax=Dovyalis caffra TaxID=77055 RepID=A0AAV1SUB9_9ROSI|nr:unnamed protein product [Dovyalis caffra]